MVPFGKPPQTDSYIFKDSRSYVPLGTTILLMTRPAPKVFKGQ